MPERAHPRSRGENPKTRSDRLLDPGSSPLTRGKLKQLQALHDLPRLIPAHAGKTTRQQRPFLTGWAHPRSRGENARESIVFDVGDGSSPLTRGKLRRPGARPRVSGLIPAHAGKTLVGETAPEDGRAHPRSRGENLSLSVLRTSLIGSSPLTRGKRRRASQDQTKTRLIPAHAGKTEGMVRLGAYAEAHPRSRGENQESAGIKSVKRGSSPLTRGKRKGVDVSQPRIRLIPAHAGKTPRSRAFRGRRRAHPRSRGENGQRPWSSG